MVYLPTFTIKINQMWVNIPYMDPMGDNFIIHWAVLIVISQMSSLGEG